MLTKEDQETLRYLRMSSDALKREAVELIERLEKMNSSLSKDAGRYNFLKNSQQKRNNPRSSYMALYVVDPFLGDDAERVCDPDGTIDKWMAQ